MDRRDFLKVAGLAIGSGLLSRTSLAGAKNSIDDLVRIGSEEIGLVTHAIPSGSINDADNLPEGYGQVTWVDLGRSVESFTSTDRNGHLKTIHLPTYSSFIYVRRIVKNDPLSGEGFDKKVHDKFDIFTDDLPPHITDSYQVGVRSIPLVISQREGISNTEIDRTDNRPFLILEKDGEYLTVTYKLLEPLNVFPGHLPRIIEQKTVPELMSSPSLLAVYDKAMSLSKKDLAEPFRIKSDK